MVLGSMIFADDGETVPMGGITGVSTVFSVSGGLKVISVEPSVYLYFIFPFIQSY
jgi:hypothetical protein